MLFTKNKYKRHATAKSGTTSKMQKQLFETKSQEERERLLRDNAHKVEKHIYFRKFSAEEKDDLKDELSEKSIIINDIEEEAKEVAAEFKERKKPLVKRRGKILSDLKKGGEHITEDCYEIHDEEEKQVGIYNRLGELISQRPMRPDERQQAIPFIRKSS